jgi:hypothetical protein
MSFTETDTFKFKITLDRHNATQNLNYYVLPEPPHFALPSTFNACFQVCKSSRYLFDITRYVCTHTHFSSFSLHCPEPVVIKKGRWAAAQFDKGLDEPLLKRESTFVYTKEGTRVFSLNTGALNKTEDRRQMFITIGQMRHVDWAAAQHLLSPFSIPFFGVKLLYDYGFRPISHASPPSALLENQIEVP